MSASSPHGRDAGEDSSAGQSLQQDRLPLPTNGQRRYSLSETLRNRFRSNSTGGMPTPNVIPNSSVSNQRTPTRSFYHRAFHGSLGGRLLSLP